MSCDQHTHSESPIFVHFRHQHTWPNAALAERLATDKTGEGLVFLLTGPGELMMQSRNPDDIVRYVVANMPGSRN